MAEDERQLLRAGGSSLSHLAPHPARHAWAALVRESHVSQSSPLCSLLASQGPADYADSAGGRPICRRSCPWTCPSGMCQDGGLLFLLGPGPAIEGHTIGVIHVGVTDESYAHAGAAPPLAVRHRTC